MVQLVQHEALDAATEGFKKALTVKLGEDSVTFDYQNASGDTANCTTIVNGFVANKVDLIMANATPALQAAYNATQTIPILGTSVTEYGVALGIENLNGTVGANVSGTSDLAPLDEQAQMIVDLFPEAKTVGLLYCNAEANSQYQVKVVKECLEAKGITCKTYTFSDSNDISAVTTAAAAEIDVLYIPTDNAAAASAEIIGNILRDKKIPAIAGEEGICAKCGVATHSISYYDLGYKTGEMAAEVLTGSKKIEEMPIAYAPTTKKYNKDFADVLGITMPEGYEAIK
ncbi:MAG: ABC transporter substrate-binding protein [Clostridia bacterium]|nr:ABC transporter substrate-binding protein [Clostridia bacterium]